MVNLLFSFRGRISRGQYWLGATLIVMVVIVALTAAFAPIMSGVMMQQSDAAGAALAMALVVPIWLVCAWSSMALHSKRLHDRGKSGYWALLLFAPMIPLSLAAHALLTGGSVWSALAFAGPAQLIAFLVNCWFAVELGMLPGEAAPNRFGDPPLSPRPPPRKPNRPASQEPDATPAPSMAFQGVEAALSRAIAERTAAEQTPQSPPRPSVGTPGFGKRKAV
ncbi:MAG: DUF805 domain-containing protein [Alphaproteobacteria bacterium]|nr:DUF805 domain-containing protein [Alphaproteobacteria bacterium]